MTLMLILRLTVRIGLRAPAIIAAIPLIIKVTWSMGAAYENTESLLLTSV